MDLTLLVQSRLFQSTLPRGSDLNVMYLGKKVNISIHAPSRERPLGKILEDDSTHFNPRSLAGATHCNADEL